MVSRRTRSQNTLGTRLVEIERKIEAESSSKRGNSSEDLRAALASVESRILLLESVNYRVGADRPALEEAYPQVLSGRGEQVTDWDDAVLAGWYWGDSALHSPAESNGWTVGTVYYHGTSGRIVQEVFDPGFADPESDFAGWRRTRVDGSWSAWTEIVSGGAVDITGPWPKAPTGLTLALNEGFYTDDGKAQGEVKFTWTGVTQNTENAPMVVDLYEVWIWRGAQSGYQRIATDIAEATFDLTTPGTLHKAKVRARGANGAWGDFSAEVSFTPEYPDEVPLPPTTPVVYSDVAQAVVRWDGFLNQAGTPVAPRPGFRHVIVERGASATGPWFSTGQPLADPGESTVPDTAGQTVWFRLITVNVLGIQSAPSTAVSVLIKGVTVPDLDTDVTDVIQDATDTANDAKDTANNADSKITNSALAPTTADGTGKPLGAIWYRYSGANMVGIWEWDGTNWVQQFIQSPAIAPGAVDESKIDQTIIDAITNSTTTANNAWEAVDVSVVSVVPQYAVNSSETTAPTTGWSTTAPTRTPGTFIWTRTVVTLKNGTSTTSSPVLVTGNAGTGTPGRGVSSTAVTYQVSASGTTPPTGTWNTTIPTTPAGQFLWTRTVITYTDATTTTSYAISRQGSDGSAGGTGASAYLHVAYATNATGTEGFSTTDPTGKTYIGTYTDATPADSTNPALYDWMLIKGGDGAPGKGISSSVVTYQASASGTTPPTGAWNSNVPAVTAGQFLWTRTVITFTDGASTTAYSVGRQGENGVNGTNAYTVLLSNESHTFAGSTTAAIAGSTTSSVIAYQGSTAVPTTIGTITGQVTGLTTSIAGNGTTSAVITVTVTTSLTAQSGTLTIPVTVGGQAFTKSLAWTVARTGATGSSGANAPVVSLVSTAQVLSVPAAGGATTPATTTVTGSALNTTITVWQYSVNGAAFSNTVPAGVSRTGNVVTITGSTMTARTIAVRMADAAGVADTLTVAKVSDGATGSTGVSVNAVAVYYRTTASGAAAPAAPTTSTPPAPWTITEPAYVAATDLWSVTRVGYSDGTFSYTSVSKVSAYAAASAAMATANGKNTSYYQTDEPTGGTYKDGDIWFDTDDGNRIYVRSGSAWIDAQDRDIFEALQTAQIANIGAGQYILNPTFSLPQPSGSAQARWSVKDGSGMFFPPDVGGNFAVGISADGLSYIVDSAVVDAALYTNGTFFLLSPGSTIEVASASSYATGVAAVVELHNTIVPALNAVPLASTPVGAYGAGFNLKWTNDTGSGVALTVRLRVPLTNGVDQGAVFSNVFAKDITPIQNALTAANGKNKNYYQDAEPIGTDHAVGDTWFDTNDGNRIYVWNGTIWSDSQDADIAIAAGLAADAKDIAETAQLSADGKNKVTRSTAVASGTGVAGDTWYQYSGTSVIGFWIHNGTGWISQELANQVIANLDAGKISTGFLDANRVQANSISVQKLLITSLENLVQDSSFEYTTSDSWTYFSTGARDTVNPRTGAAALKVVTNGGANLVASQKFVFSVAEGEKYRVAAWVRLDSGVSANTGVGIRFAYGPTETSTPSISSDTATTPVGTGTTYVRITGVWTAPAAAKFARLDIVCRDLVTGKTYRVDDVECFKMASGDLIVDGAITAGSAIIADGAITNAKIANLDAGKITTGTIDADRIAANSISIGKVSGLQDSLNAKVSQISPVSGGGKVIHNALDWSSGVNGTISYLVIQTPIEYSNYMCNFKIRGYTYSTPGGLFDLQVGVYAYSVGPSHQRSSWAATGDTKLANVILGRNVATNKMAIILENSDNNRWYYPKISIDEVTVGHTTPPDSYLSGWSASLVADISSAYDIQTVSPATNYVENHAVTTGWRSTGTTTINGGQITTDTIVAGAIKAWTVAAGRAIIADATIDNAKIANLDAGKITTGYLDVANRIQAAAINVQKLTVSDFTNLIDDPAFETTYGTTWAGTGWSYTNTTGAPGRALVATGDGTVKRTDNSNYFSVKEGDQFYLSLRVQNTTNAPLTAYLIWRNEAKSQVSTQTITVPAGASWSDYTLNGTAPTGAFYGQFFMILPATATTGSVWVSKPRVLRRATGELIVDGAITAIKVATKSLTSAQIAAETLSVNELTPNIGSAINIAINPTITDLQNGLDEQRRYYRFDNEGLKIGDPATNEELRLNPGRIEMVQAGNVPTYWEAQNFYVERMIVEAANIGSHRFEGYANGRTVIRPLRGV